MKQKEIRRFVGCSHKTFWKKLERKLEVLNLSDVYYLKRLSFKSKVNLMMFLSQKGISVDGFPSLIFLEKSDEVLFCGVSKTKTCVNCSHIRRDNSRILISRGIISIEYYACTVCGEVMYTSNHIPRIYESFEQDFNICSKFTEREGAVEDIAEEIHIEPTKELVKARESFLANFYKKIKLLMKNMLTKTWFCYMINYQE